MSAAAERILLAHGEGGRLSRRLVEGVILPRLHNPVLAALGDAALLPVAQGRLAFTTDSFVISPLFFPGGDIGRLAVFGTANDLAMAGARPRWLTLSLIIEEGFALETLERVLDSAAQAAVEAGVQIVAGDTKVVPRGAADGLFINTAGVGELEEPVPPGPGSLQPGDELLVSGPLAEHGIAVLAAREQLSFEPPPQSDCAALFPAVAALQTAGVPVRALRDATRGGLAAVFHEWAEASGHTLLIEERRLPVGAAVRGACELLGLDPLHVASEGMFSLAVPAGAGQLALDALRTVPVSTQAAKVGEVVARRTTTVAVQRTLGGAQPLDDPLGAPLPRIC
ncbi:MAG: hydrogenase expression/formation protein HypE [Pirellulales bacterium]